MKEMLGALAVILTFVGYVPYIRDTIRGKTCPHVYSWFLYGLTAMLIFAIQTRNGAGAGAYITLAAGLLCFVVLFFGLRLGDKDITASDTAILGLTLVALCLWLVAKQPLISIILFTLVDILAFIPTIRKSWHRPHTETLSLYTTNVIRYAFSLYALSIFNLTTAVYPVTWMAANGIFAIGLVLRRRQVGSQQ